VPPLVDLMAAERRFMRYDEAAFASEAASAVEERKKLRQKFERLSEFDVLFELNDEAYEESDKGPESSILWQMQEQALLDCIPACPNHVIQITDLSKQQQNNKQIKTSKELQQQHNKQITTVC
ncbi:unnamed protein product, partial [Polarella glacialis]